MKKQEKLKKKMDEIKDTSDNLSKVHEEKMKSKDENIEEIHQKLNKLKIDLEELYLIKQGLDAEIKVYKALVETTEDTSEEEEENLDKYQNSNEISEGNNYLCV